MRVFKYGMLALAAMILLGGLWAYRGLTTYPDLAVYSKLQSPDAMKNAAVRVTFLGVSTLLIEDGETALLTDGFFSRPNPKALFLGKIAPDRDLIAASLKRAGIDRLAAVIVQHSHYDHAMDSAEVAMRTGAVLVGSESTANVGRGGDMPEARLLVRKVGDVVNFGRFKVTLLASAHVPSGFTGGEIKEPLRPPVRATAYQEGTSYATLVEHSGHALLINASAGFVEGALAGRRADVVFLGIGSLGRRDLTYQEAYWRNVVLEVGARRVVPIHWDNFALPLEQPLRPIPNLLDDFEASMNFLTSQGEAKGIQIMLPRAWQVMAPFEALP